MNRNVKRSSKPAIARRRGHVGGHVELEWHGDALDGLVGVRGEDVAEVAGCPPHLVDELERMPLVLSHRVGLPEPEAHRVAPVEDAATDVVDEQRELLGGDEHEVEVERRVDVVGDRRSLPARGPVVGHRRPRDLRRVQRSSDPANGNAQPELGLVVAGEVDAETSSLRRPDRVVGGGRVGQQRERALPLRQARGPQPSDVVRASAPTDVREHGGQVRPRRPHSVGGPRHPRRAVPRRRRQPLDERGDLACHERVRRTRRGVAG